MTTKKEQEPTAENGVGTRQRKNPNSSSQQVAIPGTITVKHLGEIMGVAPIDVIKQLMRNGVMAAINQVIDYDLAATVVPSFGLVPVQEKQTRKTSLDVLEKRDQDQGENAPERSPVVTIMGHVDHGKTTLLDTIRNSRVAEREIGGITQHIGAYQVEYNNHKITFLDTPGHEAFTAIRARGTQVTDIAVLVVAADDGVMPQTIEAINHAKAANVPVVVAINKMDRQDADPAVVKRQLLEHNLVLEEWGGEVIGVPISAKENTGIEDLLENILVVAEIAELKAQIDGLASGVVIEAKLDRTKGPMATVLVQAGTLRVTDSLVAGTVYGKVRALVNDKGLRVSEAGPSVPVEILGFGTLPQAGDKFYATTDERSAKSVVEENERRQEEDKKMLRAMTLEGVMSGITGGTTKELNLILKGDVQGSVEAASGALLRLDSSAAKISILHASTGRVNEGDILLANASNAIILAFNIGIEPGVQGTAARESVEIRSYDIIYKLIEDVEKALKGRLEPTYLEHVTGKAIVRDVFKAGKTGNAAGCIIDAGKITRGSYVRIKRDGKIIHENTISSLRRFKEDTNEVGVGFECGIGVVNFNDFEEGDILEVYRREKAQV
jgi:translation initiation factor IF-2